MKKLLLSMLLMLVGMATWAQDWEAPSENEYQSSTPVYVQVKVNGEEQMKAQVAAFIDDDCRAVSFEPNALIGDNQYHLLRVWGDPTADNNKSIKFKVAWDGLVFNFTKTVPFTGETYSEIPLVLNVDLPTAVTLTNPLNIEANLPYSYDLTNDIKLVYGDESYTPLGESSVEGEFVYEWDFANSSSYFTVEGNKLTATAETGKEGRYLGLRVSLGEWFETSTSTMVFISKPEVPVTGISCTPSEWTISINDNLYELEDLNKAITVLPEDATNKEYTFVPADDAAAEIFNNGTFSAAGTYNINIVSTADRSKYATIKITVTVPVEGISISSPSGTFYSAIGENVFDLITPYINVYPEEATNKEFSFEIPAEASDAIVDGVAYQPGIYTIYVVADENPEIRKSVTVIINKIEAPESISLNIGESYIRKLTDEIQVLPMSEEMSFTYTLAPKTNTDAAAFENGVATTAGEYTLLVTCNENPKATAEITVFVLTPIKLDFPSSLTLSKFKDTEFKITLVEGDNFEAGYLWVYVHGGEDVMPGVGEAVECTPVEGTRNMEWIIRANLCGYNYMTVEYKGEWMVNEEGTDMVELKTPVEIPFNHQGWDWIYYPATYDLVTEDGNYRPWMNVDSNNRIIDLRSQTDLLYNDEKHGLFGTIWSLSAQDGMYKIKAAYEDPFDAMIVDNGHGDFYWDRYAIKPIVKGYNWIGYTNEWDLTIDDFNTLNDINQATEGDAIIGKDGFAEYDAVSGKWIAQDGFILKAGKGYLYYSNSEDEEKMVSFDAYPSESDEAQSKSAIRKTNVWKYDAGAFADNMAIIAEINALQNPEDYTIGAFVDGECRGEGNFVTANKMMISVAGKAGENVTFRLYNTVTGQYSDIIESLKYAQKVGSLKNPVRFTAPSVTGISDVTFDSANDANTIYDLNGRRVNSMDKSGMYIIKTVENGKVAAKKVVRK